MIARARLPWLAILPLYVALATAAGFTDYHARPERYRDDGYVKYVPDVVAGTAEPPGRYRVLAPYVFDAFSRATSWPPNVDWLVFRWLCLFGSLLAAHLYFRTWFDEGETVAGALLIVALLPLLFTNSWPNPDQFTELLLFTLGAACLVRDWWPAFLVVLALNALNRETSAFLLLFAAVAAPMTRPRVLRLAVAAVLWIAITIGLRMKLGFASYDAWHLRQNLASLVPMGAGFPGYKPIFGWFFLILLVPCWALASQRWHAQPRACRTATAIVAPVFFVTGLLFSSTIESRIFTAMLPLLAPAVLVTLFGVPRTAAADTPAL